MNDRELERLRELAALRLGEEIDDPAIQAIVDRAARTLGLPLAAASIILDSAQYFIASHGIGGWLAEVGGSPVEWAFCRHTITRREPFVVEDAVEHPLVRDNPLVKFDGIRSYLGVPLITTRDQALGTLCVLGAESRRFSKVEIEAIRALADELTVALEARRSPP